MCHGCSLRATCPLPISPTSAGITTWLILTGFLKRKRASRQRNSARYTAISAGSLFDILAMHLKCLREITPLTETDCFMLFARKKSKFDFPLHYHEEFELNFIRNAKGARRIVGDHTGDIDDLELVLVASNIPH